MRVFADEKRELPRGLLAAARFIQNYPPEVIQKDPGKIREIMRGARLVFFKEAVKDRLYKGLREQNPGKITVIIREEGPSAGATGPINHSTDLKYFDRNYNERTVHIAAIDLEDMVKKLNEELITALGHTKENVIDYEKGLSEVENIRYTMTKDKKGNTAGRGPAV